MKHITRNFISLKLNRSFSNSKNSELSGIDFRKLLESMRRRLLVVSLFLCCSTEFQAQVVLNEVMARPTGNQGLIVFNGNSGNEYIELYNPSCSPVDVSGYFIGMRQDFAGASGGSIRIPNLPVSVIPPNGHLVLGTTTSSSDPASVDIVIPNFPGNYCQNTNSLNLLLANADGWVALYDASGTPIDAIYWSSNAGNISQSADYAGTPCVPAGSPAGVNLESAQQINTGFPGVLNYVGNTPSTGLTFSRMQDGGAWVRDVNPSINDQNGGNCNGGNCVSSSTFSIAATVTQPGCSVANGSITITPNPGGAYVYTWNPNVSSSNSASNLAAGTYDINIDLGGCQKDTTIVLTSPSGPSAIVVNAIDPSCGATDGSVSLGAVSGGVGPYQYNFNGQGFAATNNFNGLGSGTYSLIVQDANLCTYTAPSIALTSANGPSSIAVTTNNPACGQTNGSVDLGTVTGGTGPYLFNFNNQGFASATTFQNLASGTYSLMVQDANMCTFSAPNVVLSAASGPNAIQVTTTNSGCSLNNGTVNLGTVSGGTGPYTYNFNGQGFASTTSFNNLAAGSYSLVVQDAGSCTFNAPTIVIGNTTAPTSLQVTTTQTTCGLQNGSISIGAVTGGTAPYQFNFNGTGFNSTVNHPNLAPGNYSLVVRDQNGCTYVAPSVTINPSSGPSAIVSTITNTSCGLANGSLALGQVTGGTAPYSYNFNNLGFSSTVSYPNLSSGNYTLVVNDNLGCSFNSVISIQASDAPNFASIIANNTTCGLANGTIDIQTISGGQSPYQISINASNFSGTLSYSNLAAGVYSIVIQDANACVYQASQTILGSSQPTADFEMNPIQLSVNNPVVQLSNLSSSDVVIHSWYAPDAFPSTSAEVNPSFEFVSKGEGFYPIHLLVEDANGCQDSITRVIELVEDLLLYAPNSFTPDGNEFNNVWNVIASGIDPLNFSLFIYDRWGEVIWESHDASVGWDGTYGGKLVQTGVYTWKITAKDDKHSQLYDFNGFVNVIY